MSKSETNSDSPKSDCSSLSAVSSSGNLRSPTDPSLLTRPELEGYYRAMRHSHKFLVRSQARLQRRSRESKEERQDLLDTIRHYEQQHSAIGREKIEQFELARELKQKLEASERSQQDLDQLLSQVEDVYGEGDFWSFLKVTELLRRMRELLLGSGLSRRFEELIARTDAKLFRTIGEQNVALRRIAEDIQPETTSAVWTDQEEGSSTVALAAASLLPKEECRLKQRKERFRTLAPAGAFLEEQLGARPEGPKRINTWLQLQQVVEKDQWPAGQPSISRRLGSSGAMAAMEQRLRTRPEQRPERLELLLLQVLEQQSDAATPSSS